MYPDVFTIASSWPPVTAILGADPVRFWPFDIAPSPTEQGYGVPYATHQLIYGNPDNSLSCIPYEDLFGIQVDCYARTATDARQAGAALRDSFEASQNHVTDWNGEEWEQATGLYRVSMTVEFWTPRT